MKLKSQPTHSDFAVFLETSSGFAQAAQEMESLIKKRLCNSFFELEMPNDADKIALWETRKIPSLVNLGTALEITLKCMIICQENDKNLPGHRTHDLVKLYDSLLQEIRNKLDAIFQICQKKSPRLIAFDVALAELDPSDEAKPTSSLKDWLKIFSEHQKMRYAGLDTERCRTYVDNVDAFFLFLDDAKKLADELAVKKGILANSIVFPFPSS